MIVYGFILAAFAGSALASCGSKSCPVNGTACPSDNPVATFYGPSSPYNWTNSVNWECVYSVADFGDDSSTDDDRIAAAAKAASSNSGGGVVFFPKGDYSISKMIEMPSNVVFRGVPTQDPAKSGTNPGKLSPSSKITCPDRSHLGFLNQDPKASNIGVVNLELSGCTVLLWPGLSGVPSEYSSYPQLLKAFYYATDVSGMGSNKLVLSNKIHDVSYGYPDPASPGKGNVFPWRFGTALAVYVESNALVGNNLISQAESSYKTTLTLSGKTYSNVPYPYDNRYGIDVNRIQFGGVAGQYVKNGKCKQVSSNANLTPSCAPWYFPTGITVRDNYIHQNGRVGVSYSSGAGAKPTTGAGTQVFNNHVQVQSGTTCYTVDGQNLAGGSSTNENRGFDQGGYGNNVTANTACVNRQKTVGGYETVDGEGILHQASANSDGWYNIWSGNDLKQGCESGYMLYYKLQAPSHNVVIGNTVNSDQNIGCLEGNGGNCGSDNKCSGNSPKCEGF